MKKLILSMLLLVFAASALPLTAQTDLAQKRHEADSLREIIKTKQHEIDSLDLELKDFQNKKKQVDSLRNLSVELKREFLALREECDGLSKVKERVTDSIKQLGPQLDAQKTKNRDLENYKKHVAPLVERQLSQMANDIDQAWLSKTYAETDMTKLFEELELYEAFKDSDRGVGNAYAKMKAFSDDVALYSQGEEAVNSPYDASKVAILVQPMSVLAKREPHPGRKQEAETVYGQLKDYKNTVRYFQENIIPEVDKILNNIKKDKKEAWKQVKQYLDTGDGGMIRQYLTKIPWIAGQYNLYIKQLETDPFGKNAARQTIMSLKP